MNDGYALSRAFRFQSRSAVWVGTDEVARVLKEVLSLFQSRSAVWVGTDGVRSPGEAGRS